MSDRIRIQTLYTEQDVATLNDRITHLESQLSEMQAEREMLRSLLSRFIQIRRYMPDDMNYVDALETFTDDVEMALHMKG
jgi:regulator of sirC expression with transglutaminase-like and TPR domain